MANLSISFLLEPEEEGSKLAKPYLKSSNGAVQGKRENLPLGKEISVPLKNAKNLCHYSCDAIMGSMDVCKSSNQESNEDGCSVDSKAGRFIPCTPLRICFLFQFAHG